MGGAVPPSYFRQSTICKSVFFYYAPSAWKLHTSEKNEKSDAQKNEGGLKN